jgi:hypothetical protein
MPGAVGARAEFLYSKEKAMIRNASTPPMAVESSPSVHRVPAAADSLAATVSRRHHSSLSAGSTILRNFLVLVWLAVATTALYYGSDYYRLPLQERAFSEMHDILKPSGVVGHGLGVAGSLMMIVGVGMYSLRKRLPFLSRLGKLRGWLQVHIFLCTLGPFLVILHTSFKFGGIVSIALWSMLIVVASGVFGRYLYARIPKTIHGQFLSLRAIEVDKDSLLQTVEARTGLSRAELLALRGPARSTEPRGFLHALYLAARNDLGSRRLRRRIDRKLSESAVPNDVRKRLSGLIRDEIQLEQQVILLKPFQRLFRWWHILHLPLAIVMFVIMVVHIAVAAAFGYVWVL